MKPSAVNSISLVVGLFASLVVNRATATTETTATSKNIGTLTRPCLLRLIHFRGGDSEWTCEIDPIDYQGRANHELPIIGLNYDDEDDELVSGVTYMTAVGAPITSDRIINVTGMPNLQFVTNAQDKQAALAPSKATGTRKVLGIRVKSADGENGQTTADLIDNVFTDAVNLRERYGSCSYGLLDMEPFTGTINGESIADGIYELELDENTDGRSSNSVEGLVVDALNNLFGNGWTAEVDHYMIFLPDNVPEFGAYAQFPGKKSVYDGGGASIYSAFFFHEIGHNLHLDHSSEGESEYGDDTCTMGYGQDIDDFRVCFNPPKSWALGWYADKHVDLSNSDLDYGESVEYDLIGVAEYQEATGDQMLFLRFGGGNYYVGFNRKVGINVDQTEAVDQVTVTSATSLTDKSFLLAKLANGDSTEVDDITIEVVSIDLSSTPGVAVVRLTRANQPSSPALCFSGENLVSVRGRGEVRMDSVAIGDYVRTSSSSSSSLLSSSSSSLWWGGPVVPGDETYSQVYGFLHYQPQLQVNYLRLTFVGDDENTLPLEVSPEHLLFSKGRTIAAGQVKVGDTLDGVDGRRTSPSLMVVRQIAVIQRRGVYAPATVSGEIIVSGVRASNYVNLLPTSAVNQHIMSHAFMAPVRFWCSGGRCHDETYTESEGYSHWVKYFIWIATLLRQYGTVAQYVTTLVLGSPLVVLLTLLDQVGVVMVQGAMSPGGALVVAGLIVAMTWGRHGRHQNK